MHVDRLDGLVLHVDVPDAQREVVAREEVPAVLGELDVRHARDDLAEERLGRRVLLLLKDCARGDRAEGESACEACDEAREGAREEEGEENARLACLSHRACSRMSASLTVPLDDEYEKRLHWSGWNSAAVMTSVSSSMLTGLMSRMSAGARSSMSAHRSRGRE